MFHQELCRYHGTNHKVDEEDKTLHLANKVLKNLGSNQVEIDYYKMHPTSFWVSLDFE
jgi:hypothetical protein